MEELSLGDDRWCFACGERNPHGLRLGFHLDKDGKLHTRFTFRKEHQGYTDIVHGGLLGLILDETMLNLAWRLGLKAVTAHLDVRFRKAVRVGETVAFTGWLTGRSRRLLTAEAEARGEDGGLVARAKAKCMIIPNGAD